MGWKQNSLIKLYSLDAQCCHLKSQGRKFLLQSQEEMWLYRRKIFYRTQVRAGKIRAGSVFFSFLSNYLTPQRYGGVGEVDTVL